MLTDDEKKIVERGKNFMKKAFIHNPHFSFNDWSVMYHHSCTVESIASTIAQSMRCDELLVSLGAIFHDIGKTCKADGKTLHWKHESFNLLASEAFVKKLNISRLRLEKLKKLIAFDAESVEMDVIKDADALALPSDKQLYMLYIEWAYKEGLESSIQRKLDKFDKLRFEISKKIGEPLFQLMKKDWDEYLMTHSSKQ